MERDGGKLFGYTREAESMKIPRKLKDFNVKLRKQKEATPTGAQRRFTVGNEEEFLCSGSVAWHGVPCHFVPQLDSAAAELLSCASTLAPGNASLRSHVCDLLTRVAYFPAPARGGTQVASVRKQLDALLTSASATATASARYQLQLIRPRQAMLLTELTARKIICKFN